MSDAFDGEDAGEALAFSRISDDAVDNFYCFNPRRNQGRGELEVVSAYHDERFALSKARRGVSFERHFAKVVDDFIEFADRRWHVVQLEAAINTVNAVADKYPAEVRRAHLELVLEKLRTTGRR